MKGEEELEEEQEELEEEEVPLNRLQQPEPDVPPGNYRKTVNRTAEGFITAGGSRIVL